MSTERPVASSFLIPFSCPHEIISPKLKDTHVSLLHLMADMKSPLPINPALTEIECTSLDYLSCGTISS